MSAVDDTRNAAAFALLRAADGRPILTEVSKHDALLNPEQNSEQRGLYLILFSSCCWAFSLSWCTRAEESHPADGGVIICPRSEDDPVARVYDAFRAASDEVVRAALIVGMRSAHVADVPVELKEAIEVLQTYIVPACQAYAQEREPADIEPDGWFDTPEPRASGSDSMPVVEGPVRMSQSQVFVTSSSEPLTDAFLQQFIDVLHLELRWVDCSITDEGLKHLWNSLTSIVIVGCTGSIDVPQTLRHFESNAKQLTCLELDGIEGVPPALIEVKKSFAAQRAQEEASYFAELSADDLKALAAIPQLKHMPDL